MAPVVFVDVILPLPLQTIFTYAWPFVEDPLPGYRVLVEFGARKRYAAVVCHTHNNPPPYACKSVLECLDEEPSVHPSQWELWFWMADYYMTSPGEVMQSALPSALKVHSESILYFSGLIEMPSSPADQAVVEWVRTAGSVPYKALLAEKNLSISHAQLKRLIELGYFYLEEHAEATYKPPQVNEVRWPFSLHNDQKTAEAFSALKASPAQSAALLAYFECALVPGKDALPQAPWVPVKVLGKRPIKALVEKGWLEWRSIEAPALRPETSVHGEGVPDLTPDQHRAFLETQAGWAQGKTVLLHGVMGSGKTEMYQHAAKSALEKGKHALVLLPEVTLTEGLLYRYKKVFGDCVLVYHGRLTDKQRMIVWNALLHNSSAPVVVLASRSGVFLPMHRVGLIVVDEEHDTSFKQQEPAPRYQARDTAVWLGVRFNIPVVLGSGTPSLDTWHRALTQKYVKVSLPKRFGDALPPQIELVDKKKFLRHQEGKGPLTETVFQAVEEALRNQRQVVFLQNRRGFAPVLLCAHCGYTEECSRCDVALTYHKFQQAMRCHYCGESHALIQKCTSCGSPQLELKGLGTERVEEELRILFPEARIGRLDADTARSKVALQRLLDDALRGELDILVGTQLVSKGWDLPTVDVVCVIDADAMLAYPDFRAHERAYQLLAQVAGRAGRRDRPGRAFIQTAQPDHQILQQVSSHAYEEMAEEQLFERKTHFHPPYVRLIHVLFSHRRAEVVREAAVWFANQLVTELGGGVLGPDAPSVGRVNLLYRQQLWIKVDPQAPLRATKQIIAKKAQQLVFHPDFRSVRVVFDVDPGN